ncbi:hypothetical protein ALC57_10682 [Trachymyrmex cornetzi]|uniref:GIY-YIG domain-containing protein n=2 Tax=Trachymyrmex cornetzi TaxID=471704 RepID=A0A151J3N3_9HYME|nr:hypothetical protein ALC57_10682 [Trachymyrmex cornetzi]
MFTNFERFGRTLGHLQRNTYKFRTLYKRKKPTFSGRYLNFLSSHPLSQKRGVIFGMIDRVFFLSHPRFHQRNIISVIDILLNNDYPLDFIFKTINLRLKSLFYNQTMKQNNVNSNDTRDEMKPWITLPYIPQISDKFMNIFNDVNIRLSFYSLNKLNKYIKVHKDVIPTNSKRDVVYQITCKDCDATYVGQTGRRLQTRILEHKNHINRNTTTQSVITEHRLEHNHEFDWLNVRVLDTERFLSKRLISEMIYVKLQKNSLNCQSDTEYLNNAFMEIINNL